MNNGLQAVFVMERARLLRLLSIRLGDPVEAEDALQDMWIKLQQPSAGPIVDPVAYLCRMTSNLATDRLRSATRRAIRDADWLDAQAGAVEQPTTDRALIARERLKHIEDAIATMPPRMHQAFRLYRLEGHQRPAVARDMGISVSAVEKLLQRAYRHIHDSGRDGDVQSDDRQRLIDEGDVRHGP